MSSKSIIISVCCLVGLFPGASPVQADGLLLPAGASQLSHPLATRVEVQIRSQVATTVTSLTFAAPPDGSQLFFPTPVGASVTGFARWTGEQWEEAAIVQDQPLDRGDAQLAPTAWELREALDAYVGSNAFVAALPPAPGGGTIQVRLSYMEILPYDFGEVTYRYPLARPEQLGPPADSAIRVELALESPRRLQGWLTPGYADVVVAEAQDDHAVRVRCDVARGTVHPDFQLRYSVVQDEELFVHLLTDHEQCGEDGFFLLVVEPRQEVAEHEVIPKYFTFVLDVSGSMAGYKIDQAKAAARYFIENLNSQDPFNIVTFNEGVATAFAAPVEASDRSREDGLAYVNELQADGSTNLDLALLTALQSGFNRDYARILVLLTDGLPTAGVVDGLRIQQDVAAANSGDSRLFTFGIGEDVDQQLLRGLAAGNRGEANFLAPDADIAAVLAEFYSRINRPVLTDVALDLGAIRVTERFPEHQTDLFAGTQLFVVGRYAASGPSRATLTGSLKGELRRYPFELDFPDCEADLDTNPFLPRLWAKSKIDALLGQMAQRGQEDQATIDEIIRLATRYRIQTPYTSFGLEQGGGSQDPGDQHSPPPYYDNGSGGGGSGGGGYDYDYSWGGLEQEGDRPWLPRLGGLTLLLGGLLLVGLRRRRVG